MSDKKLLNINIINFFYKKEAYRSLSNFWKCIIQIEDIDEVRIYDSGESCFQGEKFIRLGKICKNIDRKKELLEYGSKFFKSVCEKEGGLIKKMGRKLKLDNDELKLWHDISIEVQNTICIYKYENYKEVQDDLIKSEKNILIHPAMRCNIAKVKEKLWEGMAIIMDGKLEILGRNMLGNIWMNIRDRNRDVISK